MQPSTGRRGAGTLVLALAGAVSSTGAWAQGVDAYPARPVTIIIPVAAGGPTDVEARVYARRMGELLGQPFVLDYKAGAGGAIGTAFVAKAAPDGHAILLIGGSYTVLPAVYKDLGFDTLKDLAPISLMSEKPQILLVNPAFPARNFQEYVAYTRANPGKLNLGVTAQAGVNHLMTVWLHSLTQSKVAYIAYKGEGPMLPDLLSGRLDAAAIGIGTAIRLARAGKVRALGSSLTVRSKVWPELPTIAEQGTPQFSYTSWVGILAPGATPAGIVGKLSENFAKTARSPEVTGALEPDGWVLVGSTPAQFRQLIVTETERWRKLVADHGIQPE